MTRNKQIRLASRPSGWVTTDNFAVTEESLTDPEDGELLIKNIFMSVDPYMRGRMNDVKSYIPPFRVGEVLQAGVIGEVAVSRNKDYAEGDIVFGMLGWETFSVSDGIGLSKIPKTSAPLSYHLGILGMPGMTAYVGLHKIGRAQPGETVFVSAASGGVGSIVGQLAKLHGCRVAGCASTDDKVAMLRDKFGYDVAFNYRNSTCLLTSLREICPDGIDIDFENVGGEIFEAALWGMRPNGRVVMCGMISNYNDDELQPGPRGMMSIIGKSLTIQGFIVTNHPKASMEYVRKASGWLEDGTLEYHETIAEGIENAPLAFIGMLKGNNTGKQIVRIADI